jgi:hypothetical protein
MWHGCFADELEELATSTSRPNTLLATTVQVPTSSPPSTSIATPTKQVDGRRRRNKQRNIHRPFTTRRSIYWKLVDSVVDPMHAQFDFTLEGCPDDEGLSSHGDLRHRSPSDSVMARDLSGERVFFNPP